MSRTSIRKSPSENFYVSLNDMLVGVLFLFILLLMAFALSYAQRESKLLRSKDAIERVYKQRIDQRAQLLKELERELKKRNISAQADYQDGILRLNTELLFRSSEATLQPRGRTALQLLGRELSRRLPCYVAGPSRTCPNGKPILEAIYVEGHTDKIPIGTPQFPTNWELSSKRAIVTFNTIMGAAPSLARLTNARGRENLVGVSAYADTRPIDRRRLTPNRRVDFRFVLAAPSQKEIEDALRGRGATSPSTSARTN